MQQSTGSAVADAPFRPNAAPGEVIPHPEWQRARAVVLAALGRGEAVVLLGQPGTGKTLLLHDLARTLRHEGRFVRLVERGDALVPALGDGVLLVDEADRIDADALACLCTAGMPFVLAALPTFAGRLAGLPCPVARVALEPLPPEEVARFVATRLSAAGRPRDMLASDAVLALARHSGGLPRLVNVLAGSAVFLAELEGAPRVLRRHVDEAASMRDGADEDTAPAAAPAGDARPTGATAPRAEAPLAPRASVPIRSRRRAIVGAAAVGLGVALAGGWAASGWLAVRPLTAGWGSPDRDVGSLRDGAGERPPDALLDGRGRDAEEPGGEGADLQPRTEQALPEQALPRAGGDARQDTAAGTSPLRQTVAPGVPVAFRGPVYNETLNQGGQMSLVVRRRGPPGAITARFEAWGGLLGSGDLTGTLSEDGRISVSGRLMVGKNPFDCDLSGRVAGGKLTGSATFVRSGGEGRTSRSSFALTGS